jgi:hypothetical protein
MILAAPVPLPSQVGAGIVAFLVVAALGLALFFLLRSMNKQLRKVGADKRTFVDGPDQEQLTNQENVPDGSRQDR